MPKDCKTGLVLSGGGARGIAHIGVLQALEEHHIYPDMLSGASAGSIIGALYAAGVSPEKMLEIARSSSLISAFRPRLPLSGFSNLEYLRELLEKHVGSDRFEALKIPIYITATNLNSGTADILDSGSLYKSVMASASIPLVFTPVEINGQRYVDGGLVNNFPTQILRPQCDYLIGVNVMPIVTMENDQLKGLVEIATRSFELTLLTNTHAHSGDCDLIIEPQELSKFNIFKFSEAEAIYEVGYRAALEKIPEITDQLEAKQK